MSCITKIKVLGHIDKNWKDWFDGMEIHHEDNYTILSGELKDDSFMYGIINQIRDLNLKLISINHID